MEQHSSSLDSHEVWKGAKFWIEEIKKAGIYSQLKHFNDVITGKKPPHTQSGYQEPVMKDILLDGHPCDIYHSDHERGDSGCRVYIHIKNVL